ncbi:unnamed protein product, partial [Linum tenue]
ARGSSQCQSSTSPGDAIRPAVTAPRGSAAATAGMCRRRLASDGGIGSFDGNLLRFYIDDAPRIKISPTVVLVLSICFIGFVTALHVFGKLYHSKLVPPGAQY